MSRKKKPEKSRFLYAHRGTNAGKLAELDALQAAYTGYLAECVETMLHDRRLNMLPNELQKVFTRAKLLSSQIEKNCRAHAVALVSGWASSKYATVLRRHIGRLLRQGTVDKDTAEALWYIGRKAISRPVGKITQAHLDLYWSLLLDEKLCGRTPQVSARCGMRMSEMTASLEIDEGATLSKWWLRFAHLGTGERWIKIPLAPSPYIKQAADASKGILARKTRRGVWRFEVVDKRALSVPAEPAVDSPKVGYDVGLNVMVATSDGRLYGRTMKPRFNAVYDKLRALRKNRMRQGLSEDSPRLARLESSLTGYVKSEVGRITNRMRDRYPAGTVFVHEDLDLRGTAGQKRFAYRAVHHAMAAKCPQEAQNPAYTSQCCPSCEYVSRRNRAGTKFICRSCGRKSHADAVGGINLLGRSEAKQVSVDDDRFRVRNLLRARYWARRNGCDLALDSASVRSHSEALVPSSPSLTTEGPASASAQAQNFGRRARIAFGSEK